MCHENGGAKQIEQAVKAFVAERAGYDPEELTEDTDLRDDLAFEGYDAAELLDEFFQEFKVAPGDFQFQRHFGPEGCMPFPKFWTLFLGPPFVPIRIRDLVRAAQLGKWEEDKLEHDDASF